MVVKNNPNKTGRNTALFISVSLNAVRQVVTSRRYPVFMVAKRPFTAVAVPRQIFGENPKQAPYRGLKQFVT
jgi:hypothetical protein